MLTPFCISLLQVSHFKLTRIYCQRVDGKLWSINRRFIFCNVYNMSKRLFYWGKHAWQRPAFCLCGVLLAFTNSITERSSSPPKTQVVTWRKALQQCSYPLNYWEDLLLLERFISHHPLPKPNCLLFLRAALTHQGQVLGWRKRRRGGLSQLFQSFHKTDRMRSTYTSYSTLCFQQVKVSC